MYEYVTDAEVANTFYRNIEKKNQEIFDESVSVLQSDKDVILWYN